MPRDLVSEARTIGPAVPFVLASCTAVSVLSTDLFTPSIPDLPGIFGTDIRHAQAAVSINLAAYAVAQIVHGALADTFGRRRLMVTAFTLFIFASVFCAVSSTITMLLTGRFLQGLFSSVPSVVIVLIIRELFSGPQAVRVMAIHGAAVGIAPALGPMIGGYLHIWFGWSAAFWAIALLATGVIALFAWQVPETLTAPKKLNIRHVLRTYGALLTRPAYLQFLLPLSLTFAAFYAYVTTAPVVFIDLLGLPTERYFLTYVFIIAAFVGGNVLTTRLSKRLNALPILRIATALQAIGAIAAVVPSLSGIDSIVLIVSAMCIYMAGLGMLLAAGPIVLLDAVNDMPQGPASALMGAFQLGAGAIASLCSGYFYSESSVSLTVTVAAFVLVGTLPVLLMRKVAVP